MNPLLKVLIPALALSPIAGHATLLVYEGFTGYGSTLTGSVKPNANTIGLDTTANYSAGASQLSQFTVQSTGLSLGSLLTGGGALSTNSTSTAVATAKLNVAGGGYTGTLWSSYLVSFSSAQVSGTNNFAYMRSGSSSVDGSNEHFATHADSRYKTTDSTQIGVSYGAGSSSNVALGGATLATDTTYILISRFTNVGTDLSTGPGVATTWALTAAQFDAFVSAGQSESYLDSGSIGSTYTAKASVSATSGTYEFGAGTGTYISLVESGSSGTTFDELRWGSTLADVTPTMVPEPASFTVIAGFLSVGVAALRRRRPRA